MATWFVLLAAIVVGGAVIAVLARRCVDGAGRTVDAFDDWRRDLRLAVVELRVEQERIARRVEQLPRGR